MLSLVFFLFSEMTEDEQFALALKMSEQEAQQLNSQEEEEEELLRKAIAESLSVSGLKTSGLFRNVCPCLFFLCSAKGTFLRPGLYCSTWKSD